MAEASLTLPLSNGLRTWLQRSASANERTLAGEARFHLTEAMRRSGAHAMAGLEEWPPRLEQVTKDNLAAVKAKVAAMEVERDQLAERERKARLGLMPGEEERLRWLRNTITSLQTHITAIERLAA
jgi:hypothetical protein